ncbi:hypothetical protein ACB092_10G075300 [Castanea dentata]
MMEKQSYLLLQRYRRDRRNLLEFLFSSSLIKELRTPAGHVTSISDLDFDNLSADYILHSIKSGGVVDISEATKNYFDESSYPVMIQSQLGDSYFLLSDPDMSGSPPRRAPPPINVNRTAENASYSSRHPDPLTVKNIGASMDNFSPKYNATTCTPLSQAEDVNIPPLGLPCLNTGLSDDDLQESAYEILLSSLVFSGIEVHTVEDRRKEKSSKFLSGLKTKREKINQQSQGRGRHSELVDTIRIQMQISEAMDACIRQRLTQLAARRIWESIDIPKISLGLLNSVFKSDFPNEKSYIHWKSRQASILEELLYFSANLEAYERETIKSSLSKIRNSKEWDITMSPSERADVLLPITQVELKLSSLSGKFSIQGETYCWTAGYHLNIRLYEKLLFGVFDVLDEGQFIEESNELLMLNKLTWCILGITQKMHNVLYGWVLFQQYVGTNEDMLLEHALHELQKVVSGENADQKEEQYMDSLACSRQFNGSEIQLGLVQAVFFSISSWCDDKLQDYHLYFSQEPTNFSRIMNLMSAVGILTFGDSGDIKIGEVAKPIILDWVIAQNSRILEWTGRVFDLEEWEPLSSQQRMATSIVEVFRIIEETVDQFFGLNLSMDITHLQALLSIIFHSLDAYLLKLLNQLVDKNHLYPLAPPLTRYEETVIPIMKKKVLEHKLLEDGVSNILNELTVSKLCVRLNTLKYILKQIGVLEDGIRKSWALIRPSGAQRWAKEEPLETSENSLPSCGEAVDELFVTTFNSIRDTATDSINKICDFTGARVMFWDLRDAFPFSLYRGNVEGARFDGVLPQIDTVLDHICGLIDDTLRDLVAFSICRASLEAYVWVLLNGGPSRSFSDSDITLMEDDLNMLKEFFIADGEGLPRSLVEQEANFAEQILSLYSLQTGTVIQMLMTASEQISLGLDSLNRDSHNHDKMGLEDAQTLIRVLCHKKDREASKFLKRQYQLPASSDYDDTPSEDSTFGSPLISDLLKRSSSFQWTNKSQSSFKSFKKKIKEATSDIRSVAW